MSCPEGAQPQPSLYGPRGYSKGVVFADFTTSEWLATVALPEAQMQQYQDLAPQFVPALLMPVTDARRLLASVGMAENHVEKFMSQIWRSPKPRASLDQDSPPPVVFRGLGAVLPLAITSVSLLVQASACSEDAISEVPTSRWDLGIAPPSLNALRICAGELVLHRHGVAEGLRKRHIRTRSPAPWAAQWG